MRQTPAASSIWGFMWPGSLRGPFCLSSLFISVDEGSSPHSAPVNASHCWDHHEVSEILARIGMWISVGHYLTTRKWTHSTSVLLLEEDLHFWKKSITLISFCFYFWFVFFFLIRGFSHGSSLFLPLVTNKHCYCSIDPALLVCSLIFKRNNPKCYAGWP